MWSDRTRSRLSKLAAPILGGTLLCGLIGVAYAQHIITMGKGHVGVLDTNSLIVAKTPISGVQMNALANVTPGVVLPSKAVVVDSNKDAASFRDITTRNVDAGASGTAGTVDIFPTTATTGKIQIAAAASAGNFTTTITNASMAAARTLTLPDPGAAASFVMTEGAATVNGVKTFGSIPIFPTGGITANATTITEAELAYIDGQTPGAVTASKAVVVDANKDIATLRHVTLNGNLVSGSTTIAEAELGLIDSQTAGTAAASKAAILGASKNLDTIAVANLRVTAAAALTAAQINLTPTQFRAAGYWPVDTTSNAVDVEVDGALDAADIAAVKMFAVTVGGTNALTVTADGAGVTAVVTIQQGAGASCEDVNDWIRVTVVNTNAATVETYCAD